MKQILERVTGLPVKEVIKLHGDGSSRTYYRAVLSDGSTRIVMQMPQGRSSVSEEITNFNGVHKELPFMNVQRFLSSAGLPVPKIFGYSDKDGIMIIEDVGDGLFAKYVSGADEPAVRQWYIKAVDLLADLQDRTINADRSASVALQRSFDPYLLNWEFDHFREYLIEARNGSPMDAQDRLLFEEVTRRVTEEITRIPYCFVHRDFQSRNLMVTGDGSLVMLDFQDALMGPCVYDLVALLRDSYVELEWRLVLELVEHYNGRSGVVQRSLKGGPDDRSRTVRRWFNLCTVQRKMKDAGRFVFFDRAKNKPGFLQFIPSSLEYIRNAIDELNGPEMGRLFTMLRRYVPEWE